FCLVTRRPPLSTLCPYTTLFRSMGKSGVSVVLVRPETSPDDVHGMLVAKGVLTARGGATSHAAVVARGLGLPCVAGCEGIRVNEDRKSTRLNSSHRTISYAVFCL